MVSSVTSTPYSYLGQLQGASATPAAASASSSSGSGSSTVSPSSAANTTAQSLVSSLLSGSNAFTPEVLSLLQQNSSGSFDPITTLLGGTSTNDALTSLYANLYGSVSAASIEAAKANATSPASASSASGASGFATASSLIAAQAQASIAYNTTNQQNAQAVIDANSYGADGVTQLVS